jgi:ABC-2 type transport system ATP-binding protein
MPNAHPHNDWAIEVRGLRKAYGPIEAVRGIDLHVQHGEIYACVGPNGAGKTTTVEILEGLRQRDAGNVRVLGVDPAHATRQWRSRIGLVLQRCRMPPELTVKELVHRFAGYYPNPLSVGQTIELVGLTHRARARVSHLSGGELRRLDVALGIVGNPELLFLDEPTTGFDPSARRDAWMMLAELKRLGKTILLTTHYMEEAQRLADHIAIIVAGRIAAEGSVEDLIAQHASVSEIHFLLPSTVPPDAMPLLPLSSLAVINGAVIIETQEPLATLEGLIRWARSHQLDLPDLTVTRPTLEDVYLKLTRVPQ